MTVLSLYADDLQGEPETLHDHDAIADVLDKIGVTLERWETPHTLPPEADQEEVTSAYREAINRLNSIHGFQSIDVVSLRPDHPDRDEFRKKFLAEHKHADFEIRFFVDGRGLFYLHVADKVYLVLCEKGDLISVPANTTHWFDMGRHPDFKCIRFFTTPDGWVGEFTGSDIASRFPDFDEFLVRVK